MARTTIDPDAAANFGDDPLSHRTYAGDLLRVEVDASREGTIRVVLTGEIDLVTVPVLRTRVRAELARAQRELVLDMRRVGFLGSSGLAELIEIRTEAQRREVGLRLITSSRAVLRPLIATGLITMFDVAPQDDPVPDTAGGAADETGTSGTPGTTGTPGTGGSPGPATSQS